MDSTKAISTTNTEGNSQNIIEHRPTSKTLIFGCIVIVVLIGVAEYLSIYVSGAASLILYFVVLLGLIGLASFSGNKSIRGLCLASGLVPMVRILSFSIQTTLISYIYLHLIIAIPALVGIYCVMRGLKYDLSDIGFNRNKVIDQTIVAIIGLITGMLGYFIYKPEAWINDLTIQSVLFPAIVLLVTTGFLEEMIFRGIIQKAINTTLGKWGWILIALVYSILSLGYGSLELCGIIFALSLFFSWIVYRTGSIVGVALAHGLFNIGIFLIFPFIF